LNLAGIIIHNAIVLRLKVLKGT